MQIQQPERFSPNVLCAGDTEPEFESKRCPTYHRKDYCLTNPHSPTSVDYFGPLEIKRGIAVVKRWGVIFTCMTSRAVHIEVANSLDTSSCINALRRFISRRGQVKRLRSDNGTCEERTPKGILGSKTGPDTKNTRRTGHRVDF